MVVDSGLASSKERELEINKILLSQPVDLEKLKLISRLHGGFLSSQIRTRVWPKLMHINRFNIPDYRKFINHHRDDFQVEVDVARSLWNISNLKDWKDSYREKRRKALSDIIMAILNRNSKLFYYQGFHDLVSIFLLVMEDDHLAFAVSEGVSRNYVSDYMCKDFEVVGRSMKLLMCIVKIANPTLYKFLNNAKIEPFFATSWLITWFAHDVKTIEVVARLYDVLLCSHPIFIFYICAAYIIHLREEILAVDCDFATVHNLLVLAPRQFGFPVEAIISSADQLYTRYPVATLITALEMDASEKSNNNNDCEKELLQLIRSDMIAVISKPYGFAQFVDSDKTLLKNMHITNESILRFPLVAHRLTDTMTTWGWRWAISNYEQQLHQKEGTEQEHKNTTTTVKSKANNLKNKEQNQTHDQQRVYGIWNTDNSSNGGKRGNVTADVSKSSNSKNNINSNKDNKISPSSILNKNNMKNILGQKTILPSASSVLNYSFLFWTAIAIAGGLLSYTFITLESTELI